MIALAKTAWKQPRGWQILSRRWKNSSPPKTWRTAASKSKTTKSSPPPPPPPSQWDSANAGFKAGNLRTGLNMASQGGSGNKTRQYNFRLLESLVLHRFQRFMQRSGPWKSNNLEYKSYGINSQMELDREAELFKKAITRAFKQANDFGMTSREDNPLFWNLRNAFVRADSKGLEFELKYAFQSCVLRNMFPKHISEKHFEIADLRYPYEWYPATRQLQRTIHLHVGPTNSGKTYNALKALENAKTGVYAGPLRLLAHEVYTRFTAKGKPCALITGEEQRIPTDVNQYFASCTVEMSPLNTRVDVGVIDEIQMIGDPDRGWAWTQAFLGMQAKELHLCGEERAVDIITDICARIGDECVVHRYERLNPLHIMSESLDGDLNKLQKGDAVVSFSRVGLHNLKAGIEETTGKRCAIVYGSLPPETRAQQAGLFNDPDNAYDILVASDAIGMGLNLEIKRVIFEVANKFDGYGQRLLTTPEVKQIAGRAGRYRTANQAIKTGAETPALPNINKWGAPGFVTTLDDEDLALVRERYNTDATPIEHLGIQPPNFLVERFASYFPSHTPLAFILSRLREMGRISSRFNLTEVTTALKIAEVIQEHPMAIEDRCIFLTCPVSTSDQQELDFLWACAACVSQNKDGHMLDIGGLDLEVLDVDMNDNKVQQAEYLKRLERLHKNITLYLWLSYRYRGVFHSQHLAFHVKELVETKINEFLEALNYVPEVMARRRDHARRLAAQRQAQQETMAGDGPVEELTPELSDVPTVVVPPREMGASS